MDPGNEGTVYSFPFVAADTTTAKAAFTQFPVVDASSLTSSSVTAQFQLENWGSVDPILYRAIAVPYTSVTAGATSGALVPFSTLYEEAVTANCHSNGTISANYSMTQSVTLSGCSFAVGTDYRFAMSVWDEEAGEHTALSSENHGGDFRLAVSNTLLTGVLIIIQIKGNALIVRYPM